MYFRVKVDVKVSRHNDKMCSMHEKLFCAIKSFLVLEGV